MSITAIRYHDISAGHRVHGHENKCGYLHGHNYRVTFHCAIEKLDSVGRVIDFSVMKSKLCMWLEKNWDHKMLLSEQDPYVLTMLKHDPGVMTVPFNPTAENMADFLLRVIGPIQLEGTGVTLVKVEVQETRKCSASAAL